MVQPSSLIFLVIVAIWAAFLIQHWVRRREHLATARSVDKFSEAMRVLERRTPLPVAEMSSRPDPGATGGASSGERPAVVVKRATVSSPLRARVAETATGWAHEQPLDGPLWQPSNLTLVMRRARGVFFLAALLAVPVTAFLSAVHVLKWLSVGIAAVALAASLVWLRVSARREQAVRRQRRAMERALASRGPEAPRLQKRDVQPARQRRATDAAVAAPVVTVEGGKGVEVRGEVEPAAREAAAREVAAPVEGGWQPVPVPRPTYALKDRAPAPRPAPATDPGRPVPIEVEDDEIELMAAAHGRRHASGT